MRKTTNRKSSEFVAATLEFQANNLQGVWEGCYYVVYSYGWFPLFMYSIEQAAWLENSERYSVSTSKQRTQCHPGFETKKMNLQELKNLLHFQKLERIANVA